MGSVTPALDRLFTSPELPGWALAPEGAAIYLDERAAVIADVHLGYEWARAAGGDMIPAHSLEETIARLTGLLARFPLRTLIVAGDLVESARPCPRTARDFRHLVGWLRDAGIEFRWVRGNHDPVRRPALPSSLGVGVWTITHGDRPIKADFAVFGHHHPSLKAGGLSAPCFLIGPKTIALPAFSPNAAGLDILSGGLPEALKRERLRCVASSGDELLDFGPWHELAAKLGR